MQGQLETVKTVSKSILQRTQLEDPIHLAHQWSRDSINDLSANEVDVSNLLDGNVNHLFGLDQAEQRFDRNTNDRRDRIDRRIQLVDTLQRHIEQERLKRNLTVSREN